MSEKKPTKVFIIGTNHVYQYGEGAVFGDKTCSSEQEAKFRQLLNNACKSYGVAAIGEELRNDALIEKNRIESVPRNEARALSLPHRYCDPNREERTRLGIQDESRIRVKGQMQGRTTAQIEEELFAQIRTRELYWRDQISTLDAWPILFICGSSHVLPFSDLIRQSGSEAIILEGDWRA